MRRAGAVVLVVAVVAAVVLGVTLLVRERGGPEHRDVTLPGDVPATFYSPGDAGAPAVVVAHGYSGDRATMSSLARSIAAAGYAVLAIDFRGHGANPHGFSDGDRADDLDAALDWLEDWPEVDGDALALLGHSMGGHAVVEVARDDRRADATIVLGATGRDVRNALYLFGESEASAAEELDDDASVEVVEGANHITILWFDETVEASVAWLDATFGVARAEPPGITDPRLDLAPWYLLCVVVAFAGVGFVAARVGPQVAPEAPAGPRTAALIAAALAAAFPAAWFLDLASVLGPGWGEVVSYLVVAGAILYLPQLRRRNPAPSHRTLARLAAAGALSLACAFLLLAPLGGLTHRLVPNVQRVVVAGAIVPLLALFFVQLQALLRRGPRWRASAASVAGHAAVLGALLAGVVGGVFPGVVALALPLLAGTFGLVEVFGAAAYAAGRNGVLVGVVESLWIAGIAAVAMPLPA